MTDKIVLSEHAMDPDTLVISCRLCGSKGSVMSKNWNWNDKDGCWEPQPRHLPQCDHFTEERKKQVGVPFCVRKHQTAYTCGSTSTRL